MSFNCLGRSRYLTNLRVNNGILSFSIKFHDSGRAMTAPSTWGHSTLVRVQVAGPPTHPRIAR